MEQEMNKKQTELTQEDMDVIWKMILNAMKEETDLEENLIYLIQIADHTEDEVDRNKYLKKALELDPHLYQAEMVLIDHTYPVLKDKELKLHDLLEKVEEYFKKQVVMPEEYAADYVAHKDHNGYLQIFKNYVGTIFRRGQLRKGIDKGFDLLLLNEEDPMCIRYDILAALAELEEEEKAKALFDRYAEDQTACDLFAMTVLYHKLDQPEKAEEYLVELYRLVPDLEYACHEIWNPTQLTGEILSERIIPENTWEAVVKYHTDHPYLSLQVEELMPWMIVNQPKDTGMGLEQ